MEGKALRKRHYTPSVATGFVWISAFNHPVLSTLAQFGLPSA